MKGQRDGFESYAVRTRVGALPSVFANRTRQLSRNTVCGLTDEAFPCPRPVAENRAIVRAFMSTCAGYARVIFQILSDALSLQPHERFECFHRPSQPSADLVRLLKYHAHRVEKALPYVPQVPHTDLGSLTFLFAPSPGLQVFRAETDDWAYVQPRAGHAVVNLGDSLSMLTGGFLRSSLHRVGPLPGADMPERYSFAFLMRPENQTILRPVQSPMIVVPPNASPESQPDCTSGEWIARKFGVLRAGRNQDSMKDDWVLTSASPSSERR